MYSSNLEEKLRGYNLAKRGRCIIIRQLGILCWRLALVIIILEPLLKEVIVGWLCCLERAFSQYPGQIVLVEDFLLEQQFCNLGYLLLVLRYQFNRSLIGLANPFPDLIVNYGCSLVAVRFGHFEAIIPLREG